MVNKNRWTVEQTWTDEAQMPRMQTFYTQNILCNIWFNHKLTMTNRISREFHHTFSLPFELGRSDDVLGRTDDVVARTDDVVGRGDDVVARTDDVVRSTGGVVSSTEGTFMELEIAGSATAAGVAVWLSGIADEETDSEVGLAEKTATRWANSIRLKISKNGTMRNPKMWRRGCYIDPHPSPQEKCG